MKKPNPWLGALALAALLTAGCARHYEVIDAPSVPLARFGKITVGHFGIEPFMDSLKGTERYEKYLPVAREANQAVEAGVQDRLGEVPVTPGGPELVVSADMEYFATGSGATRALAFVGLVPQGVGQGDIQYRIRLHSNHQLVASYLVHRKITGPAAEAYAQEARNIVQFLRDNQ